MALIELHDIHKEYDTGKVVTVALNKVSLQINTGEFVAVMGVSGSGKSTLMNILGFLDHPTSGDYFLEGQNTSGFNENDLADIRNQRVGFIFQAFNLLPRTTAIDNVRLPLIYAGIPHDKQIQKAEHLLTMVGLNDRMQHKPNELSGGQQQRVAIARALVNDPTVIFADEPTGNLDSKSSSEIMHILRDLNVQQKHTIIMVTHEHDIAAFAQRIITMQDGKIISDKLNGHT